MTFVDTSVLFDVLQNDPLWAEWSQANLLAARARGPLAINAIVFAELSVRYDRIEDVQAVIRTLELDVLAIPSSALFLAGKAYARYRRGGGTKAGVLSDFFIGAHASMEGAALLTRDTKRLRQYFPALEIIAPGP